jgi:hypothetical protein
METFLVFKPLSYKLKKIENFSCSIHAGRFATRSINCSNKMSRSIALRNLAPSEPTLCIPQVFSNVTEERVRHVFDEINLGKISRIDMVALKPKDDSEKASKFKRIFVHFDEWYWNESAVKARTKLIEGKEVKVVYDRPWFWKVSASKIGKEPVKKIYIDGLDDDDDDTDRRPKYDDRRSKDYDHKPKYDDRRSKDYDHKPKYDDRRSKDYDHKPKYDDRRSKDYDHRPKYDDRRPRDDDRKPKYDDRRPRDESRSRPVASKTPVVRSESRERPLKKESAPVARSDSRERPLKKESTPVARSDSRERPLKKESAPVVTNTVMVSNVPPPKRRLVKKTEEQKNAEIEEVKKKLEEDKKKADEPKPKPAPRKPVKFSIESDDEDEIEIVEEGPVERFAGMSEKDKADCEDLYGDLM